MEEIVLESVRLTAADDESEKAINQLRIEGIHALENSPYVFMNIVLVSTENAIQNVNNVLASQEKSKKSIVILLDSELHVPSELCADSILSFSSENDSISELKKFLSLIRYNLEIHGMISFDGNDFFTIINGRCNLSIHTCGYKDNISEAFSGLQNIKLSEDACYLLTFSVEHYNPETFAEELYPVKNYMDSFPEKAHVFWNFRESPTKEVTLVISNRV